MMQFTLNSLALISLWVIATTVLSLCAATFYPVFKKVLGRCRAETRASALLAYGLAMPVTGFLLVAMIMQPDLASWIVTQHCHAESCSAHRPGGQVGSARDTLLVTVVAMGLICFLGVAHKQLLRGQRYLRALHSLSRPAARSYYRVVETGGCLAWCAGILRPRVYVSKGLVALLGEPQLQAVLAHEQAHAMRRDNLRAVALKMATVLWPRQARNRFFIDLGIATEEACDQAAARAMGSTSPVIDALRILGQRASPPSQHTALTCHGCQVDQRIVALQRSTAQSLSAATAWCVLAVFTITAIFALADLLHHLVEWYADNI